MSKTNEARQGSARRKQPKPEARQASPSSGQVSQRAKDDARPPITVRAYDRLQAGIRRQADHIVGLVLALVGAGLALAFVEAAGPFGATMLSGARSVVGLMVYLVPVALVTLGGMLLLGKCEDDFRRVLVGYLISAIGLVALFHLLVGNPPVAAGGDVVSDSGGWLGAVIAYPLERVAGFWGAGLVLVMISSGGVMIARRTSIREVLVSSAELIVYVLKVIWVGISRTLHGIARLSSRRRSATTVPPAKARPPARNRGSLVASPDLLPKRPPAPAGSPPKADTAVFSETSTDQSAKRGKPSSADALPDGDGYRLPPLSLLDATRTETRHGKTLEETARQLEAALHDHDVNARLTGVVAGPTVTRYEIELAPGVKVARVTGLSGDIAYALATPDIRILAPIPGRSAIGVEVPNRKRRLVTLGQVLSSPEAARADHPLVVGLGEDISGSPVLMNLAELPHLLIAGATGAGKSSCINSIITSILMRTQPEDVRLVMVDPKRVELGQYNGVPHLLTSVITKPKQALEALQWAVSEMDRRYELLADGGVRDISGYLEAHEAGALDADKFDRFPYMVLVIDELNDLMMVAGRDVEAAIVRIAQMARAVGIHLVIATQRPSVNVITGVIKANIPSRFAFAVASQADSRVIIDSVGADKLVGMGDMLVVTAREPRPRRVQGAWVSEPEVAGVVDWVRDQKKAEYRQIADEVRAARGQQMTDEADGEDADLVRRATELVVRSQLGSTSMLQRKLRVGFARAGRIMDILESKGIVGPSEGSKAREVLVTADELDLG